MGSHAVVQKCHEGWRTDMKKSKQDLIQAQWNRAEEALSMAKMAAEGGYWNSAGSELYYAFFCFIRVLFSMYDIDAQTHKGIRSLFSQKFIKEKGYEEKWGYVLSSLFDYRQKGNYGDMRLNEKQISPLIRQTEEFKKIVLDLLLQAGYKTNNES